MVGVVKYVFREIPAHGLGHRTRSPRREEEILGARLVAPTHCYQRLAISFGRLLPVTFRTLSNSGKFVLFSLGCVRNFRLTLGTPHEECGRDHDKKPEAYGRNQATLRHWLMSHTDGLSIASGEKDLA